MFITIQTSIISSVTILFKWGVLIHSKKDTEFHKIQRDIVINTHSEQNKRDGVEGINTSVTTYQFQSNIYTH